MERFDATVDVDPERAVAVDAERTALDGARTLRHPHRAAGQRVERLPALGHGGEALPPVPLERRADRRDQCTGERIAPGSAAAAGSYSTYAGQGLRLSKYFEPADE